MVLPRDDSTKIAAAPSNDDCGLKLTESFRPRNNSVQQQFQISGSGCFADLKSNKLSDRDFVSELLGNRADMFSHGNLILPDEALVNQAVRLVEFLDLTLDNFGDRLRRLVFDL